MATLRFRERSVCLDSVFDTPTCLLCGETFDPLYCHVGVLYGICTECGPPSHRAWETPKLGKNEPHRPPAGFQLFKTCACGSVIGRRSRKCCECRRLARLETAREGMRRLRESRVDVST